MSFQVSLITPRKFNLNIHYREPHPPAPQGRDWFLGHVPLSEWEFQQLPDHRFPRKVLSKQSWKAPPRKRLSRISTPSSRTLSYSRFRLFSHTDFIFRQAMAHLTPDKARDILAEHEARGKRGLPTSHALTAADLRLMTPSRNVSFGTDEDSLERKRRAGIPKPWQIGFYRQSPNTSVLLNASKSNFKTHLYTNNAWPLGEARAILGRRAWDDAVRGNPDVYAVATHRTYNNNVMRMLGDTAWSTRGAFKTEAKKILVGHYQLNPPESLGVTGPDAHRRAVAFTRDRVEYLKSDHVFLYGPFNGHDSEPFANTAICLVIERALFRSLTHEAREVVNPMPLPLIALAATCLHNALDEWASGYYIRRPMKEEFYGETYRGYVRKLEIFKAQFPNRYNILMSAIFTFCSNSARNVPEEAPATAIDDGWQLFGDNEQDDEPLAV
jgi:Domain of unknown function (DUF6532)